MRPIRKAPKSESKPARVRRAIVELGRYIVCDPGVCRGKPTMRGTRVLVADVLEQVEAGLSPAEICRQWYGWIVPEAVAEAVHLARTHFIKATGLRGVSRRKAA